MSRRTRDVRVTKEQAVEIGKLRRVALVNHRKRKQLLKRKDLTDEKLRELANEHSIYKRRAVVWSRMKLIIDYN